MALKGFLTACANAFHGADGDDKVLKRIKPGVDWWLSFEGVRDWWIKGWANLLKRRIEELCRRANQGHCALAHWLSMMPTTASTEVMYPSDP